MLDYRVVDEWDALDDSDGFDGGSGLVFARGTLPDVTGTFIFKHYQQKAGQPPDWDALEAVIRWSRECPAPLRQRCALPRDIVVMDDQPVGIIMPEAQRVFYRETRSGRKVPNSGDFLGSQMAQDPALVWAGLGDLLLTTLMLHRQGIWVVDLHPRNYLVRSDRVANAIDPITLLLDCDGLSIGGRTFLDIQPEDYWGPNGVRLDPSAERDLFCFALTTIKTVGNDHSLSPPEQAPDFIAEALGVYSPLFDKWLALEPMSETEINLAQMLGKILRSCRGPVRDRVPLKGMVVPISQVAPVARSVPLAAHPGHQSTQGRAVKEPVLSEKGSAATRRPTETPARGFVIAVAVACLVLVLVALGASLMA